jgi:hypothetical protein
MNKHILIVTFALAAAIPAAIGAAPTRVFISGSGSNTNPCSPTLPCRTLACAVSQVAPGGYLYVLDSSDIGLGVPVSVSNSVTIDGGPGSLPFPGRTTFARTGAVAD